MMWSGEDLATATFKETTDLGELSLVIIMITTISFFIGMYCIVKFGEHLSDEPAEDYELPEPMPGSS